MHRNASYLEFSVRSYDEDGRLIHIKKHQEALIDWPQALKDEMRAVYSRIEAYAESIGLMYPGTSEDL